MLFPKLLPFRNVAANSVASLELPLGMTYQGIMLKLGGTTFTHAHITNIKAKLNGKVFYEVTGTYLDSINDYRGRAANAANLMIDFGEPAAKTVGGMYGGGIGTGQGVNSFTLEVTIGAATAPTLEAWAMQTAAKPLGVIHALINHSQDLSAAGKFPVILPYGSQARHLIKRVYFFHTNLTEISVKKNGLLIWEELEIADIEYITEYFEGGKTAQSGLYVVDFCLDNNLKGVLDTSDAQSLQFDVTVSAADTLAIYAEYITRLGMV